MIRVYRGEPYLARRALEQEAGKPVPASPSALAGLGQGSLFGIQSYVLDLSETSEAEWSALLPILEKPHEELILLYDPSPTAARSRFYKSHAETQEFTVPKGKDLERFLASEFADRGIKPAGAVLAFLARLEATPAALVQEVEKLCLLPQLPSAKDLPEYLAYRPSISAFDLVRKITAGNQTGALADLRELWSAGSEPFKILGALNWEWIRLAQAKMLWEENPELSPEELAARLNLKPYPAREILKLARKLAPELLLAGLEALISAESELKKGSDPESAFVVLTLELAGKFSPNRLN